MAIDPDISVFYSTDVYGVAGTLTHNSTVTSIVVLFYRAGAVNVIGDVEVRNAAPTARCITANVSTAARGDTLAISGVTYYIMDIEPINTEETVLHLSLNP